MLSNFGSGAVLAYQPEYPWAKNLDDEGKGRGDFGMDVYN